METDGLREEETKQTKETSGWNLQAGGPEEQHRCVGRKEKGRVGWRQSPWRPKCEEEEDERKIEMVLYVKKLMPTCFSCIFCPQSRVHMRESDIRTSVWRANTFASQPRAAFAGLEEGGRHTQDASVEPPEDKYRKRLMEPSTKRRRPSVSLITPNSSQENKQCRNQRSLFRQHFFNTKLTYLHTQWL